jgi:hypothetical protein
MNLKLRKKLSSGAKVAVATAVERFVLALRLREGSFQGAHPEPIMEEPSNSPTCLWAEAAERRSDQKALAASIGDLHGVETYHTGAGVCDSRCRHRLRWWRQFSPTAGNFVCCSELFPKFDSDIPNIRMHCDGQRDGQL